MKVIVFGGIVFYGLYLLFKELSGIGEIDLSDIDFDDDDEDSLGI